MIATPTITNPRPRVLPMVLDARSIAGNAGAAAAPPRARVLGAVAPQHRLLRGPTPPAQLRGTSVTTASPMQGRRFVSHMEVLDALLAGAHDRLLNRLSRIGMRRGQAQRFVVAATGRLLRASQRRGGLARGRLAIDLGDSVGLSELAARTRISEQQAEHGLQIVLAELSTVLARMNG